jgi:hypothetical protein
MITSTILGNPAFAPLSTINFQLSTVPKGILQFPNFSLNSTANPATMRVRFVAAL